jgi:hypothetical protein
MSAQFDFNPGLDLSSLSSTTLAQVVQCVSQISPLSNIGGVICSTTTPDVANNSRFSRYIWIDIGIDGTPTTPIIKTYNGTSWSAVGVATNSVTTAMIKEIADKGVADATAGVDIARLKRVASGVADSGKANFLVVIDTNGQYVDIASPGSALGIGSINLKSLIPLNLAESSPSTGQVFLVYNSPSYPNKWGLSSFDPSNLIAGGNEIPPNKLSGVSVDNYYKVFRASSTLSPSGTVVGELAVPHVLQRKFVRSNVHQDLTAAIDLTSALSSAAGSELNSPLGSHSITSLRTDTYLRVYGKLYGYFSGTSGTIVVLVSEGTTGYVANLSYSGAGVISTMNFERIFKPSATTATVSIRVGRDTTVATTKFSLNQKDASGGNLFGNAINESSWVCIEEVYLDSIV